MDILRSTSRINNTKIFYEIVGEGHPIVLIHSEYLDNRIWDFQIRELAKYFQVIRYDLRGHGKSDPPTEQIFYYQDLYNLLIFLNIEKTYLLGLSLGASVAVDFSLMYPNMVDALILSGPTINNYRTESSNEEYAKLEAAELSIIKKDKNFNESVDYLLNNPIWKQKNDFIQSYVKDILIESSLEWMLENFSKELCPPVIERLSVINIPTLLINGQYDSLHNKLVSNILESNISNLTVKEIKDTGKLPNIDKPKKFNKIVLDYLLEL